MPFCQPLRPLMSDLQCWYNSAELGRDLALREAECLRRLLSDTFGYHLVALGVLDHVTDSLGASRIRHPVLMADSSVADVPGAALVGDPCALPFAPDSLDAVVLPHLLDLSPAPRRVLDEVERVLIPEGRVIILGFNALSLWGLGRALRGSQAPAPWQGRYLNLIHLEKWLSDLGFSIESQETFMFRLPFGHWLGAREGLFDKAGQRVLPGLGAVYALRAVKRVSTLTPLRPSWRRRHRLVPGRPVEPTTRGGGGHA
ncbi:MAG: methyltransferase domain-containing protein [Chromatiaceae bacterium]|nr:methyltransferase domain-containing protein [Chromatiaceae bacterium]